MKLLPILLAFLLWCLPVWPVAAQVAMPLHTGLIEGRAAILDAHGARVRLKAVNWYGAESAALVVGGLDRQPLAAIAKLIKSRGFNAVRLPWCNEMVERNPVVSDARVAANPHLKGQHVLAVYDAVVKALTAQGLMVVLDNHRSRGDWCCDAAHGDGLWYTSLYPEQAWLADWQSMAGRYRANPLVIAAELRNEIRSDATLGTTPNWGSGDRATDWRLAAQRGAEAVLKANPNLLIIVGTPDYQTDLSPVRDHPLVLTVPHRLVYAAHDYAWDRSAGELADPLAFEVGSWQRWDFVREGGHPYTAPVFISEWGGCLQGVCAPDRAAFVRAFMQYQRASRIDWAYWPLNGVQMTGYGRTNGALEGYGLLKPDWSGWADPALVAQLTGQ
ncbi:glycoside hydrolase family 5 protein [Asticcacaulis sp. EMRT-3]|uniref:glycoside hydrolase family 5 protein n=1 Tax=Asticcacaulis sp. EMRT-3 TaxID=3040349 RepID=UPI0024AF26FA|nr:glycoside hydrolase family 5 protein [Asticcacaulis sp. EMRT-3]MDI7774993.1 glycoside hydrolase family 5 protein [Asticcacaulis sp. EMRT-3]